MVLEQKTEADAKISDWGFNLKKRSENVKRWSNLYIIISSIYYALLEKMGPETGGSVRGPG